MTTVTGPWAIRAVDGAVGPARSAAARRLKGGAWREGSAINALQLGQAHGPRRRTEPAADRRPHMTHTAPPVYVHPWVDIPAVAFW